MGFSSSMGIKFPGLAYPRKQRKLYPTNNSTFTVARQHTDVEMHVKMFKEFIKKIANISIQSFWVE